MAQMVCPRCNGSVTDRYRILKCINCGHEPFEVGPGSLSTPFGRPVADRAGSLAGHELRNALRGGTYTDRILGDLWEISSATLRSYHAGRRTPFWETVGLRKVERGWTEEHRRQYSFVPALEWERAERLAGSIQQVYRGGRPAEP